MYRQLVVPLDGSPAAEVAIQVAGYIARKSGARLHLVMVVPAHLPVTRIGGSPVRDPALDHALSRSAQTYLQTVCDALDDARGDARGGARGGVAPLHVTWATVQGDITDAICAEARRVEADLVVVTPHGAGASVSGLGHVPKRLIRRLDVPLLICRFRDPAEAHKARGAFARILMPLDEFSARDAILSQALALGSRAGTEYTLLSVVATLVGLMRPDAAPHTTSRRDAADERRAPQFEPVVRALRERGYAVTARATVLDQVHRAILRYAHQIGADLILLSSHGRRGLHRALYGSVAATVAERATSSVLVVKARARAPGRPVRLNENVG